MDDLFGGKISAKRPHPAPYSRQLIEPMRSIVRSIEGDLPSRYRLLDPFGGIGGIFALEPFLPRATILALEIEPEWAEQNAKTRVGSALSMPWDDASIHIVVTSPSYGNRMADHHEAKDDSKRLTYKHSLGRNLSEENSGQMQWGDGYREFHLKAWKEAHRVLAHNGYLLLNIKDHIRKGRRVRVSDWHAEALALVGFAEISRTRVSVPSMQFGANGSERVEHEDLILFRKNTTPYDLKPQIMEQAMSAIVYNWPIYTQSHCFLCDVALGPVISGHSWPYLRSYFGALCDSCAESAGIFAECPGDAHKPEVGGMMDHCGVCMPRWGRVPQFGWRLMLAAAAWKKSAADE